MEKAYITIANASLIVYKSNINNINLSGDVYKIPIYFFSKYEKNALLAIQELLKDPVKYFNEIYIPYVPKDTLNFVHEGNPPAYHKNPDCIRLGSSYTNFEIPSEIKARGTDAIYEFREWFKTVEHLLEKPDVFVMRMKTRWNIETNVKEINKPNSGNTDVEYLSIEELEGLIDKKIKEAGQYYYSDEKIKKILRKYSQLTYLAVKPDPLPNNDTGISDQEVKKILKDYDEKFKRPLKKMLIEYYRLKHNPDISMDGLFLEKLGFVKCGICHLRVIHIL